MLCLRLWKILKIKEILLAEKEIAFYNFTSSAQLMKLTKINLQELEKIKEEILRERSRFTERYLEWMNKKNKSKDAKAQD